MPAASLLPALLACFGTLGFMAILAAFWVVIAINGAIWAGAIVGSAALTTLGISLGSRRHRRFGPLLLAVPGFAALAAASGTDWRARHHRASCDGVPKLSGSR